jgi:hypothetical protein
MQSDRCIDIRLRDDHIAHAAAGLHVDTSPATTLTGHDEEALNEQAATTQPGTSPTDPGRSTPIDRPGPHGWTFGYPLALVLMILTGAMLYMAFKRRRWL